jgi:hypothetical protein
LKTQVSFFSDSQNCEIYTESAARQRFFAVDLKKSTKKALSARKPRGLKKEAA